MASPITVSRHEAFFQVIFTGLGEACIFRNGLDTGHRMMLQYDALSVFEERSLLIELCHATIDRLRSTSALQSDQGRKTVSSLARPSTTPTARVHSWHALPVRHRPPAYLGRRCSGGTVGQRFSFLREHHGLAAQATLLRSVSAQGRRTCRTRCALLGSGHTRVLIVSSASLPRADAASGLHRPRSRIRELSYPPTGRYADRATLRR